MKKQYFYTIMEDGKFLASNFMRGMVVWIGEAVKLETEDEAISLFKKLNEDRNFKIVKVECIMGE